MFIKMCHSNSSISNFIENLGSTKYFSKQKYTVIMLIIPDKLFIFWKTICLGDLQNSKFCQDSQITKYSLVYKSSFSYYLITNIADKVPHLSHFYYIDIAIYLYRIQVFTNQFRRIKGQVLWLNKDVNVCACLWVTSTVQTIVIILYIYRSYRSHI